MRGRWFWEKGICEEDRESGSTDPCTGRSPGVREREGTIGLQKNEEEVLVQDNGEDTSKG